MSEIEVGEYVRIKNGYIAKIINKNNFRELSMRYGVEANYLKDIMFIGDDNIVKHSKNIIDLVEVGDILRIKVQFIPYEEPYFILFEVKNKNGIEWKDLLEQMELYHKQIVAIVTKEQFEHIKYEV